MDNRAATGLRTTLGASTPPDTRTPSAYLSPGSAACLSLTCLSLRLSCVRLGDFSFGTKKMDGTYSDHAGVSTANHHDTIDTVVPSHKTGWAASPRVGMHMFISKTSDAGVPSPEVFTADLTPHGKEVDGKTSDRVYGWMQGVAGFPGAGNDHKIAAIASHCGDLSVPLADGTKELLENPKFSSWDYNGIVLCRRQAQRGRPQPPKRQIGRGCGRSLAGACGARWLGSSL